MAKDSFKFLTKYLATFYGEDVHEMDEAKEEAVRAVVEFVKAPDMFQVFSARCWKLSLIMSESTPPRHLKLYLVVTCELFFQSPLFHLVSRACYFSLHHH